MVQIIFKKKNQIWKTDYASNREPHLTDGFPSAELPQDPGAPDAHAHGGAHEEVEHHPDRRQRGHQREIGALQSRAHV